MKTKIYSLMLLLAACVCLSLSSCNKDEDFDYPMTTVYGVWKATDLYVDGKWVDITKYPYTKFAMSITFYENGDYYGYGYLGTGWGTYKASGNKITTYVDGKVYATYTINYLSDDYGDLTLLMGTETLRMKVKKQLDL